MGPQTFARRRGIGIARMVRTVLWVFAWFDRSDRALCPRRSQRSSRWRTPDGVVRLAGDGERTAIAQIQTLVAHPIRRARPTRR